MPIETGNIHINAPELEIDLSAKLLMGIASSAEDLTNGRGWPDGVHGLLETLGSITGVSRVWIFQTIELTSEYITQDYTFEWASNPKYVQIGMQGFSMFRTPFNNEDYRDLIESRKRGEWQKVISRKLAPSPLREDQIRQGIESMLTIPIMVEDKWWGILGLDDCEREYDWTDKEIALLRTATFLISNAVIRDRLGAVRKQFDTLQSITESSAWEYNFKKGHFWSTTDLVNALPGASHNMHLSTRGALKLVHHEDRRQLIAEVLNFIEKGKGSFRHDLRLYSQCGETLWVEVIGKVSKDSAGRPEQLAGIAIDIRRRKQREEELHELATTDHLTGAMNRAVFEQKFKNQFELAVATGAPLSLLVLDIDYFKRINDTWGHDAGDIVLRNFVYVCEVNLRSSDLFARIGGEEFAILLPSTGRKIAKTIGERIRRSVADHDFKIGNSNDVIKVTTSIGCASYDHTAQMTSEVMFKMADNALFTAKRTGRNRLIINAKQEI